MKYSEIPQFTSWGSYQVNMPLKYLKQKIEEWIAEENLQLNPDFQRGHVWTEEQQVNYIEFLLKGGQSSRVIYFNHPDWITSFNGESFNGDFVCVDGLQRLTAVMKFLGNEIKVFGCHYKDFEGNMPNDLDMIFNVNNLETKKEVLKWYLEMNSGGTVHTKDELNKVKGMLENL